MKKAFNLNNIRKPEGDETFWALALAITAPNEAGIFPNNEFQDWEPVLELSNTDYAVRTGNGEFYVQIGTDLVYFKAPRRCPEMPSALRDFCEQYTEIPDGLAPVEEWELFVELAKEFDESTLEELEELIGELSVNEPEDVDETEEY